MKHFIKYVTRLALGLGLTVVLSCEQMDTEYESFLEEGEITYPGVGTQFSYKPGRLRAALVWHPSPDPSITQYIVYYNNMADSVTVEASTHDPAQKIEVIVPGLLEYVYSFRIYAKDAQGNRSIPQELNNVKVYGDFYQGSLLNRPYDPIIPYELYTDGKVELNFRPADTINLVTHLKYTNDADEPVELSIAPDVSIVTLEDHKMGTPILYRSSYIPVRDAIDEFWANHYDTFPEIKPYTYVLTPKSGWSEKKLANDVGRYGDETPLSKLWDGSDGPQGYPNIFHSNDQTNLPHHFTFDLGAKYKLGYIEETGRNCCHNPDQFEVWGIGDLTGASTSLPGDNPGWTDESLSLGWKLLGVVNRTDDGSAPYKVALNQDDPPAVRYIRIRILHTVNGNTNTSNLSEITFWHRK